MLKMRIVAAVLMLAAAATMAGPLPKAQIAVTAKWVVHLDLDCLATTKTCSALTNSPAAGPAFQNALARYRALLGVDPLRELRSVTLYGEDVTGNRGAALVSGNHDLCAYVGHNVLMDGPVDPPAAKAEKACDAIILCCMSESYFKDRLAKLGVRPVMLTTQLMYPGAFILRDALPVWAKPGSFGEIRVAAGAAYAKNQKISLKAAKGVFAVLP